ncbi:MAG: radical SAM protein [Symploca sp. SIO1A3]|nr:radical SAM protein [Symploca sp. SIO1A3]
MMTTDQNTIMQLETQMLNRRFVLRPELHLLYDKQTGVEHRLNDTALHFIRCFFQSGSITEASKTLSSELAINESKISLDLSRLWDRILSVDSGEPPIRQGGAPPDWLNKDLHFPLVLEIELTKVCNWRCDFCYNVWKTSEDYPQHLPDKHLPLDRVIAIFDEAAENGAMRIRLSGGEPTMHPHFDRIVLEAGRRGFRTELFTNGSRMTEERTRLLSDCGVRTMLVSIHGTQATHDKLTIRKGAYHKALNAMELAVNLGIEVVAEMLLCVDNMAEIEETVRAVYARGVRRMAFMPYVPYGLDDSRPRVSPQELPAILDRARSVSELMSFGVPCAPRHCLSDDPVAISEPSVIELTNHCGAGILWASVSFDGQLRHCPHSPVFAGKIEEGIGKVFRERIVPEVRRAIAPKNEVCNSCSQFSACRGGCHLDRIKSYPRESDLSSKN